MLTRRSKRQADLAGWHGVRRVLAVRLDSMGDVLMTTPALRAIAAAPTVDHVALLTSPAGAAVARLVPAIDDILVYEAPWMKASTASTIAADTAMIATMTDGAYDAAIIFTVFSQTPFPAAMLCRLAGIPRILAHCRERAYTLVSDAVAEVEPEQGIRHEVRRHLDLVAHVGWRIEDERLAIAIPAPAKARIASQLAPGDRWAVVHPGASAPSRRWPPEFFAAAMQSLAHDHGWRLVVTGDAYERELCASIIASAGIDATNLAGQLDLAELAALIDAATLLISNNTGPAHLAAAVGTPVVDLYALTNPQHTPWMVPSRVLSHDVECRWCFASVCKSGHHLCLRGVLPDAVVAAGVGLIAAPRSADA